MNENLNDVIRNKERCVKILSLSPKIRYAGIINNFGRTIAGKLAKRRDSSTQDRGSNK